MANSRLSGSSFLSESFRNVTSHWIVSLICGLVFLSGGFATVHVAVSSAGDLTRALQKQVELGSNVYVVTSPVGQNLSAAKCEALRNVAGVRSAGARSATYTATISKAPNDPITIWEVTPGFVEVLYPDLKPQSASGGLFFGRTIAAEVGIAAGATLDIDREGRRFAEVAGVSSLSTERVNGAAKLALAPLITDAPVSACFVEAEITHRDAVEEALVTWFGPASSWTVAPLLPPDRFEVSLEDALRSGPLTWVWAVLGGFSVVTAGSLWWSRRQEFALYGLLGFRSSHVLGLLSLEWVATMIVPAVCGGLLAFTYAGYTVIEAHFVPTTAALISAYYLVICTTPAVGYSLIRGTPPVDLLKGA